MHHQSQFPAIPYLTVSPVTTSGVSAANVVATIEVPASHHDRAARQEVLVGGGAGPPRVEERDGDGEDEVERDDHPVDRGESHAPASGSAACSPFRSIASSLSLKRSSARSASVN